MLLGAGRDIEVKIYNKAFEQKGAKITFHIYNDCDGLHYLNWISKGLTTLLTEYDPGSHSWSTYSVSEEQRL